MKLTQKAIVIIGGTSGIGLSAAKALEKDGANLVLVGLGDASADDAKTNSKAIHGLSVEMPEKKALQTKP